MYFLLDENTHIVLVNEKSIIFPFLLAPNKMIKRLTFIEII